MNHKDFELIGTPKNPDYTLIPLKRSRRKQGVIPSLVLATTLLANGCTQADKPPNTDPIPAATQQESDVTDLTVIESFLTSCDHLSRANQTIDYDPTTTRDDLAEIADSTTQTEIAETIHTLISSNPPPISAADCDLFKTLIDYYNICPVPAHWSLLLNIHTERGLEGYTMIGNLNAQILQCERKALLPQPETPSIQLSPADIQIKLKSYSLDDDSDPTDLINQIVNKIEEKCPDWTDARRKIFAESGSNWATKRQQSTINFAVGLAHYLDEFDLKPWCEIYQTALDIEGRPHDRNKLWKILASPDLSLPAAQAALENFKSGSSK